MKLLPAKELNSKLQDQKKSEIDAGLFLAKKIDKLREDLQEEQKKHDETVAGMKVQEEILTSEFVAKKGRLDREIETAESKLAELREPLDEEWKKVIEISESNTIRSNSISERETLLEIQEKESKKRDEYIEQRELWVIDNESRTENLIFQAINREKESRDLLSSIKENEKQIEKDLETRIENVEKRETNITKHEIDLKNQIKEFNKEKASFDIKKKRWKT